MNRLVLAAVALVACAGPEAAGPGAATAPAATSRDPALIARDAFLASFSPDGSQLAYGKIPDNSGVAILDLRTGATRALTTAGKVPAWSPDGRRLAYVVGDPARGPDDEEVWVVASDGSGARRLASGAGTPSWTADGARVVVHGRKEGKLLAIAVDHPDAPAVFYDGPLTPVPALSPDGALVGGGKDGQLQVFDRQSKQRVFSWPTPGVSGLTAAWSPDHKRLAFAGNGGNPIGLWVIDLEQRKAVQVAIGHFFRPVWSPDSQTLVFDLREPKRKALWRMSRKLVDRCLERAAIADTDLRFGAGACPEALHTPGTL
jgi:Tol biopolymer transport system component